MKGLAKDLSYAARVLTRVPGFTTVVVLTLALGIGANTAVFSLGYALLLRSLPVDDPSQLRLVWQKTPESERPVLSARAIEMLASAKAVQAAAAYNTPGGYLAPGRGGVLETIHREEASSGYFTTLGLRPAAGRFFTPEEDRAPSGSVVISHAYWKRRFHGDPRVIGTQFEMFRKSFTVVGVAPEGYSGVTPERAVDLWQTIGDTAARCLADPGCERWRAIVRLRPGVTDARAGAEMNGMFRTHLEERAQALPQAERARLTSRQLILLNGGAGDSFVGRLYRKPLSVLMALVGLLLLLACVSVGNMVLARAAARSREMAVRLALGAGRFRLFRQLLVESALLAIAGGALGCPFAWWAAQAMVKAYMDPRAALTIDVSPDLRVLAFTAGVSIATALVFGILPALRATRVDLASPIKGATGFAFRRRRFSAGKLLASAQVALSVVILFGAGLLIRTLVNLKTLEAGYSREHVVSFSLGNESGYAPGQDAAMLRLLDKVRNWPGVIAASAASPAPPAGGPMFKVSVPGYQARAGENADIRIIDVTDGFFETVGTPLLRGRLITPADRGRKPNVAVVNASFARQFFGGADPVGRTIEVGTNYGGGATLVQTEIVGVVADARYSHPKEPPTPTVFPYCPSLWASGLVVRTSYDPRVFAASLPQLVAQAEPSLRVLHASTLRTAMDRMLTKERMLADLSGFLGAFALVLASMGIYGVLAQGVRRRTAEIGLRMALGASRGSVIRMVLKDVGVLLACGAAFGIPAVLAGGKLLTTVLFDLKPADPATLAGAVIVLGAVAVLAGLVPARQASRIEPTQALRIE